MFLVRGEFLKRVEFFDVSKFFRTNRGGIVTAVDDVSFSIEEEEVVALVGESGSGKTTLGRLSTGLTRPSKGKIVIDGVDVSTIKDPRELWRKAQAIPQDPYAALDPYLTVEEVLGRPLRYLVGIRNATDRRTRIQTLLMKTGLDEKYLSKRIRQLSGGERQRVLFARAFIADPSFVVADEPTTMIDFVHRKEIIDLLMKLRGERHTCFLFITHDLSLAARVADRIAIMFSGSILEDGSKSEVIGNPLHPYSQLLTSVTPERLLKREFATVRGSEEAFPANYAGCRYANRCPYVMDICRREFPGYTNMNSHKVACFKYS
jgi:oligopeptide/dipeptide ABC transporter ATP-binding protein